MTTDQDLELSLLKRVFDWHDAPANAPRTLDLPWQEAPGFFGLPGDTPTALKASWDRIYMALDAMATDGRVEAEVYVNRVRNLKPGYRGTIELQADLAAHLAAERDKLEDARARLDADSETLATALQELEEQSQILDQRVDQLTAARAELEERQALFDRDCARNRGDLEATRAAVDADLKAAGQWRMAGVGAVTLAVLAGVYLAATQGLFG
jgi:hypothetical protein